MGAEVVQREEREEESKRLKVKNGEGRVRDVEIEGGARREEEKKAGRG